MSNSKPPYGLLFAWCLLLCCVAGVFFYGRNNVSAENGFNKQTFKVVIEKGDVESAKQQDIENSLPQSSEANQAEDIKKNS